MITTENEKKRSELLDTIIKVRGDYERLRKEYPLVSINETLKYCKTQDPMPSLLRRHMVDLMSEIPMSKKLDTLIDMIRRSNDVTKQELECLYMLVDEQRKTEKNM